MPSEMPVGTFPTSLRMFSFALIINAWDYSKRFPPDIPTGSVVREQGGSELSVRRDTSVP
jgi:hypothetical protein